MVIRARSTTSPVLGCNIRLQTWTARLCKWTVGLNLCRCTLRMSPIYGQCQWIRRIKNAERTSLKRRVQNLTSTRGIIQRIAVGTTGHGWRLCAVIILNIQNQSSIITYRKSKHVSTLWRTTTRLQRIMEMPISSGATQLRVKGWFNLPVGLRYRITTAACS